MNWRKSLTFKFVAGFVIIISPLIIFLFYNNLYAISVVREQVSSANKNLLADYVKQVDKQMKEINNYLNLVNDREPDVNWLNFMEYGTDDYMLTKQKIFTRFQVDLGYFQVIDTIFLYNIKDKDIVLNTRSDYYLNEKVIGDYIEAHPHDDATQTTGAWQVIKVGNETAFMKLIRNNNLVVGCWIKADTVAEPLKFLDADNGGGSAIMISDGTVASDTKLTHSQISIIANPPQKAAKPFQTVTDYKDGRSYLIVDIPSIMVPIKYVVLIPEASMLKNLPFFRLAIYVIPLGGLLILSFYFVFVRKVLLTPMKKLIRGMQRITRGDWDVRLEQDNTTEFAFVIRTFNNMVGEISNLKIDVYEQQLLTKEAEFKHLQVQIKPHFYLNSLNIITSLAATKQYDVIQKMARYLAEYFRFNITTSRRTVTLEAEIKHIRNYLEIQKLRFPNKLTYEINLPDSLAGCSILPLTIQTLVENSIIHGFMNRRQLFVIQIDIHEESLWIDGNEETNVWVCVQDNGVGFTPEILKRLQTNYLNDHSSSEHLGLHNVLLRLQMRYGDRAQLVFSNAVNGGAIVQIRIPAVYLEEKVEKTDDI
ncbi:sensor histidine kinase [Paenibacillus sp. N3.4]|uniref:sensor histidine kinase n=1 Tax=Paenibacillus sp. N3.4 TaxID=2603222 RepID=UPI0011C7341F|nr:histidine kinase [Paenibacillus sp. N3.4]TXK85223.1 HAMP domain-containing protein [Paenibacillus sp. N3.4]